METGYTKIDILNHYSDCLCCKCLGHLPTSNEVVALYSYSEPKNVYSRNYYNMTMNGNFFEDFFDSAVNAVRNLLNNIRDFFDFIRRSVLQVIDYIRNITFEKLVKDLGELIGNLLIYFNPIHVVWDALKTFPLTAHFAEELDKLLGGALTTIDNLSTLTGRALRGDAISKGELLQDALFCIRVAVAIFSGPAGWVALAAGQLKQGTLGKTALGRDILSIIEVAGLAYVAGSAIYDAAADKATNMAMDAGKSELMKNVHTGDPYMDAFLGGAVFAGVGAAYAGTSVYDSFVGFTGKFTENTAITRLAEQIGGPFGRDIAGAVVKGVKDGEVDPSSFDFTKVPQGYSLSQFTDDMAKLGSSVKDSFVSFLQSDGGSFALPKFTIDIDIPNLKMPDSILLPNLPDINIAMPSVSMPKIEFPTLSMPDFSWDIGSWDLGSGRKSKKRKSKVKGTNGKYYTIYMLEDGSIYYVQEYDYTLWLLAGGAALLAAVGA